MKRNISKFILKYGGVILFATAFYIVMAWWLPIRHLGWYGPLIIHLVVLLFAWIGNGIGVFDGD